MAVAAIRNCALAPIDRLVDALVDPRRRGRTVLLALVGYVALWTLYGVLAKGSQDIHFDMGELIAWAREPALGTPKHPPFAAWLVKAWFGVFPLADWAYYLLAMVVAAVGLWIAWLVSGAYLDGEKRAAGLALLTLVPFFNFHALKLNANAALIPLWAATTLFFLRSFETRSLAAAALAGLFAAAAMLGKYWSIVLLAGLAVAALADPRRGRYFGSAAPWVTVAAGTLALAPHVAWLVAHDFSAFGYALSTHPAASVADIAVAALGFLGGVVGYAAAPVLLALAVARPSRAALADAAWPATPQRRLALVAFTAPLLLATVAAFAAGAQIVSLWAMPALSLLPVVLLSSSLVAIPRAAVVRLVAIAIALPVIAVAAAPAIAIVIHRSGVPNHASHYRLIAQAIERTWRQTTDRPLRLVGSYTNVVNGVVFYLSDRPSTYDVIGPDQTPWADAARIAREGIALVCPLRETRCVDAIDALAVRSPAARRTEVEIARRHLGADDKPERYLVIAVPPQGPSPARGEGGAINTDSGPA